MPLNSILHILHHPNIYGITVFVAATLIALSLYHFVFYFQVKDKVFLLYSLYTFLLFVYTYYRDESFFLTRITSPVVPYIVKMSDIIKWSYVLVYFSFAKNFVELERYNKKWDRLYTRFIRLAWLVLALLSITAFLRGDFTWLKIAYNYYFLPVVLVIAVILWVQIYRLPGTLKNYILIGSFVYTVVSTYSHYLTYTGHPFRVLFYFSVIFEMVFFALGLGIKQKSILEEKNRMQDEMIKEYMDYLQLQEHIQKNLDKEIEKKADEILRLNKEKTEEEKLKRRIEMSRHILELRIRALQTRMNPHFLFNSLNTIKHFIVKNKKEEAIYFLGKLARFLRMILDHSRQRDISLDEELQVIRLYVEIENIRLDTKIELNIHIQEDLNPDEIRLPAFILQPLVENAIWHGLLSVKGDKKIDIRVEPAVDILRVTIEDNGIGMEKAAQRKASKIREKKSVGIELIQSRLETYYNEQSERVRLHLEDIKDHDRVTGTRVVVEIPRPEKGLSSTLK